MRREKRNVERSKGGDRTRDGFGMRRNGTALVIIRLAGSV